MSVNTKAIINKSITPNQIVECLKKIGYNPAGIYGTHESYFIRIHFTNGDTHRSMSVFYGDVAKHDYGIDGVLLTLGYNGFSVNVMISLLEEFGGYLKRNDCDENYLEIINIEKFFINETEFIKNLKMEIINELGVINLDKTLNIFDNYIQGYINKTF